MCKKCDNYSICVIYPQHTLSRIVREDTSRSCALVSDVTARDVSTVLGRAVLGEVVGKVVGSGSPATEYSPRATRSLIQW